MQYADVKKETYVDSARFFWKKAVALKGMTK